MAKRLFHNQQQVVTVGVFSLMAENPLFSPTELIERHFSGDWGTLHPEDKEMNAKALARGYGVVMSVFDVEGERVWVHSYIGGEEPYTTVLLPEEY